MQRIADRAQVDKRVLSYHFGDRERLFAAVTRRLGDRMLGEAEEALADVVDPDEGFAKGRDEQDLGPDPMRWIQRHDQYRD